MTAVVVCAHPKGGVGRSTTVYMLGMELARQHPDRLVILEDLDPALHLSRMWDLAPQQAPMNLRLTSPEQPTGQEGWINLVDTAPEASFQSLRRILSLAEWLLIPVKGPEAGSVQVLPAFLRWVNESFEQSGRIQLLGFVPTMFKPRRAEAHRWLEELRQLAAQHHSRVFDPIHDLAEIATWRTDGHPYAKLGQEIADAVRG